MLECAACGFRCQKPSNLTKHLATLKHKTKAAAKDAHNCAVCGKAYKSQSGLWKHSKQCGTFVAKVLEDNKELRAILLEQKDILLSHIEIQQKQIAQLKLAPQFNLNVFLNEQCKDAVNWDEFISTLALSTEESLTASVAKSICDGIKLLGTHRRPIHCVDAKSKLCIKSENVWEHDADKVKDALQRSNRVIQRRFLDTLREWEAAHPDWTENDVEAARYASMVTFSTSELDQEKCAREIARSVFLK
jgi:hypothetical protein